MKKENFHCSISAKATAKEAVENINHVERWWNKHFEGSAENINNTFSVHFGETFVNFEVAEIIPEKKLIWNVTDSYIPSFNNKKEWNGTKVIWEISSQNNLTKIDFTHEGLEPEIECYNECSKGWTFFVTVSLLKLITEGKGLPDLPRAERQMS